MSPRDYWEMLGVAGIVLGALWGALRYIFAPHLRDTIKETVKETVGAQLAEVPKLTTAVRDLTGAIDRQNTDAERLSVGMEGLRQEFSGFREEFGGRVLALERAVDVKPPRRRKKSA